MSQTNPTLKCPSCGAPVSGLVCDHCGRLTTTVGSVRDENAALDELHNLIHQFARDLNYDIPESDKYQEQMERKAEKAAQLIRTGFIPDHKEVLLEAGVYCVQYMRSHYELEEAARSRLEGITTKLKLMPQDEQTRRAVEEFEEKIEQLKKEQKMNDISMMTCGAMFLVVLAWLIWAAFKSC